MVTSGKRPVNRRVEYIKINSRSELRYRLNCSVNLISVFWGEVFLKTGMGKSNSKNETELSDIISYKIRKQRLAISDFKTGLVEETQAAALT